ncbi:MAG: hypothetical protein ACKVJK_02500 [Methylophagaceae bacterium]|jgi:hypothetical protein|tara:strand:- start:398 stop:769 length:372 start_codon:yes stop_codon:yes gene_type:complete
MLLKDIKEDFPFISVVHYGGNEYVGIIINQDQYVTTMYIYTALHTDEDKKLLLDLGDIWWWESNRLIPISIFLRNEIYPLHYGVMTMNSKDVKVTLGPTVNLGNLSIKRVKRKQVQLVKKPKE